MRYFVLFLFSIYYSNGYTQSAESFILTDARWNVVERNPKTSPEFPQFVETKTSVYGIKGDTLGGGREWHEFYSSYDSDFLTAFNFRGFLREENGVVLFTQDFNTVDTLYNFNLQTGDSFSYKLMSQDEVQYMKIERIDSVLIDGVYHKRFHFEKVFYPPFVLDDTWIEGVGSIKGPLFPLNASTEGMRPDSNRLSCYKRDGQVLWWNRFFDACYIENLLPNFVGEHQASSIKVFPNPASNQINIELPVTNGGDCEVLIFNSSGSLVFREIRSSTNRMTLNINSLPPNSYLLQVRLNSELFTRKIIVK